MLLVIIHFLSRFSTGFRIIFEFQMTGILKYLALVHYCLITMGQDVLAQEVGSTVFGIVAETSSQLPVEYVAMALFEYPDSVLLQTTVTDPLGKFSWSNLPKGHYFIETSLLGFDPGRFPIFEIKDETAELNLGTLFLNVSEQFLDEIEVKAISPTLINDIDRKIYFAENDIQSQSGSASDVLQNIPSITLDAEGEVYMRGSSNITFLLNGKPSSLLNNNSAIVLEQLPAHTIERIEIITNPSAKYKPDGTAGIINIVTKKNALPGFNGSVLGNVSSQNRYNGNMAFNYNPGKWNFSTGYGFRHNNSPRTYDDFRIIPDETSGNERTYDQNTNAENIFISHSPTMAVDFNPNDQNSFGLTGSWFSFTSERQNNTSVLEEDQNGTLNDYMTLFEETDKEWETEIAVFAEHQFEKEDHNLAFEASHGRYDEMEDSHFQDLYQYPAYPEYRGHNIIHNSGQSNTLNIDYAYPLSEEFQLETGYAGEFYSDDFSNFFEYYDIPGDVWIEDLTKTNLFLIDQSIHAAYATLSKQYENFGLLAGIRAEQTLIESNLVTLDSIVPNNYFKLYPTLHLSYKINEQHELGLSYSRRVNRPDPDELNPFPEYADIRDLEAGNPYLKPEQIHSIEMTYQWKAESLSFQPTLYYRQVYDAFTEVSRYVNDTTLLTTQENLSTETSGGLEMILSWTPHRILNFNFNTNLYYNTIDASNLGYEDQQSMVSSESKLAAYIDATSTTRLQLNANYRSSMLTSQGKSLPVYFLNAGFRQDIFKRKASLTLTLSDIFNTMKWEYIIDTPELYQKVTRKRKSQIFYVGFVYRFGITTKKSEEELMFEDRM